MTKQSFFISNYLNKSATIVKDSFSGPALFLESIPWRVFQVLYRKDQVFLIKIFGLICL
jgi:hypothetical protein